MEGEDGEVEGMMMRMKMGKRAEIDRRAPFRSVKEAVMLFGEKVLANELLLYPNNNNNNLKQMNNDGASENGKGNGPSKLGTMTEELENTKESLEKAKEECSLMANCLSTLQEELERTKKELQQLKEKEKEKEKESEKKMVELDIIEDLKFVEDDSEEFEDIKQSNSGDNGVEFQKKRCVTFANPPSLAKVMVPRGDTLLQRHPSLKKKKKEKKAPIPLLGRIFSKKY